MAERANRLTGSEKMAMSKCVLCGEEARGRGDGHLLFECTVASVVNLL